MIPINCHLWQKENITTKDFDFEIIKTYWDYSHRWRDLGRCKKCGQLYISDSIEFLDWNTDREDEIYTIIIPVSEKELKQYDFSRLPFLELGEFFPHIFWSPDYTIRWIGKKRSKNNE